MSKLRFVAGISYAVCMINRFRRDPYLYEFWRNVYNHYLDEAANEKKA